MKEQVFTVRIETGCVQSGKALETLNNFGRHSCVTVEEAEPSFREVTEYHKLIAKKANDCNAKTVIGACFRCNKFNFCEKVKKLDGFNSATIDGKLDLYKKVKR